MGYFNETATLILAGVFDAAGYLNPVVNIVSNQNLHGIISIFTSFWDLIETTWGLYGDFSAIINLLDFLPGTWLSVIFLSLGIVITLRVYSYVKDISLFGFKI